MTVVNRDDQLQSVNRALDIVCAIAERHELGISELTRKLVFSKSTVHRVLQTLTTRGFVERTRSGRYRLGLKVLELGNSYRFQLDLVEIAEPILKELSQLLNANTHLAKLDQTEVVDLTRVEYPMPVRVAKFSILRRPAHCTGLGKVLLAYSGKATLDQALQKLSKLTAKTITQPQRFLQELRRIRELGYGIDNEEFSLGIRCVAAPVFSDTSEVIAAISVSALITHLTYDKVPEFVKHVMRSAHEVSTRLGYRALAKASSSN